ncbi:MAG TPA: hypothetical protein VMN82_05030 [Thermoanaerobaculia bacterium]|nr:hypothetical protein [Thermoanaerobaculia bacterium]
MTIWIGQDGTLNDDDGDGPAASWDPIAAWEDEVHWGSIEAIENAPYPPASGFYVGAEDWSAALNQAASSLGGGAGGGGAGGASWGSAMGSLGSGLGQAFGGGTGKDVGNAVGDIFGSTLQGASEGGWGGALAGLATSAVRSAVVPAIQAATKAPPPQAAPQAPAQAAPQAAPAKAPPAPSHPAAARQGAIARRAPQARRPAMDPRQRLLLVLDHMAKTYGMPPAQAPRARSQAAQRTQAADSGAQPPANAQEQLSDFMAMMTKPPSGQATS